MVEALEHSHTETDKHTESERKTKREIKSRATFSEML